MKCTNFYHLFEWLKAFWVVVLSSCTKTTKNIKNYEKCQKTTKNEKNGLHKNYEIGENEEFSDLFILRISPKIVENTAP